MLCTLCLHVRDNARATPVWGLSVKCFNQFYECFYGNLHHFFSFFKLWSCITQHLIPLKKRKETVLCLLSFPQLCLSFESNSSFLPCNTDFCRSAFWQPGHVHSCRNTVLPTEPSRSMPEPSANPTQPAVFCEPVPMWAWLAEIRHIKIFLTTSEWKVKRKGEK